MYIRHMYKEDKATTVRLFCVETVLEGRATECPAVGFDVVHQVGQGVHDHRQLSFLQHRRQVQLRCYHVPVSSTTKASRFHARYACRGGKGADLREKETGPGC